MMPIAVVVESVLIESSPGHVWEILTGFGRYGQWNSYLRRAEGALSAGGTIRFTVRPPGRRALHFKFHVDRVTPGVDLRLSYIPFVSGLLDRDWDFHLEAVGPHRTRFTQHVMFRGRLVPFYRHRLEAATHEGLQIMNAELKAKAEARMRLPACGGGVSFLPRGASAAR